MKKTLLSITTTLALFLISCNDDDDANKRMDTPKPATFEIGTQSCGDGNTPTVVLTAQAEGAISFVWRLGNIIIEGETGNTLTIKQESGVFPYAQRISVAGVNKSGEGIFSVPRRIFFEPCVVPEQAIITGADTIFCHQRAITLNAVAKWAEYYQWYKDGVEIPNANRPVFTAREQGNYTVIASNSLGDGNPGEVKTITRLQGDDCIGQFMGIQGYWNATGMQLVLDGAQLAESGAISWSDTIVSDQNLQGEDIYTTKNFADLKNLIIFFQDDEGEFFFRNTLSVSEQDGMTVVQMLVGKVGGRWILINDFEDYYLDIANDGSSFVFPNITHAGQSVTSVGVGLFFLNAQGRMVNEGGIVGDMKFTNAQTLSPAPKNTIHTQRKINPNQIKPLTGKQIKPTTPVIVTR